MFYSHFKKRARINRELDSIEDEVTLACTDLRKLLDLVKTSEYENRVLGKRIYYRDLRARIQKSLDEMYEILKAVWKKDYPRATELRNKAFSNEALFVVDLNDLVPGTAS